MTNKLFKILLSMVIIGCVLCSSFSVFAEESTLDYEINIQPNLPTTEATEPETEEPATEEETQETVTTTEATTKPVEKPTKKPDDDGNNDNNNNNNGNSGQNANAGADRPPVTAERTTEEQTTEEVLPEGAFYVYLQLNNGTKVMKTLMEKEGLVPEPDEPKRKGFLFEGWYSDEDYKTPWNFFTDYASKEMTIYAKWVADPGTVVYDITVVQGEGGTIHVNPQKASKGEPVTITIIPDEGKRLVAGSLLVNGEPTDILSFVMPKGKVTITASFENIPEIQDDDNDKKSPVPVIVAVLLGIIGIAIVVVVIINKRRNDMLLNYDPDEVVEDDDDDGWIDESIVVEDGFKEGKIVKENVIPDFGTPEDELIEEPNSNPDYFDEE